MTIHTMNELYVEEGCPIPYIRVVAKSGDNYKVSFGNGYEKVTGSFLRACIAIQVMHKEERNKI